MTVVLKEVRTFKLCMNFKLYTNTFLFNSKYQKVKRDHKIKEVFIEISLEWNS